MEQEKGNCPRCGNEIPNAVLYQCARCFTKYCGVCDKTEEGKFCPGCGLGARIVLDQGPAKKDTV